MLPSIISCTRSWSFAWHLLWRSTTERKNIVKLMAISQTIHTVCWKNNYFSKRKFKLFNSLFHSVYLVLPKSCFLLKICLPCVICGMYVMKINAVSWHSVRHTSASLVYVCMYFMPTATLNQKKWTRLLYLGDTQRKKSFEQKSVTRKSFEMKLWNCFGTL